MAQDVVKTQSTINSYQIDKRNDIHLPYPIRAVVKDNIDPTHSGRIRVYSAFFGGPDPDDDRYWESVKYMSPWMGITTPDFDLLKGTDKTGYGSFVGNPQSYGFWASAPDIGSEVICIFINGKIDDGYYIGSPPVVGLNHMIPAIGAATTVVPNSKEATTYGGTDRIPVTELNYSNPLLRKSSTPYVEPKPIHSYQAAILHKQGLIRDNLRGTISSSSQRETPSKVFGFSTPGTAIYKGGYDSKTIKNAANPGNKEKLQIVGRTGGHSIVMDDGTYDGKDQLMRLRTSAGHMIMMNDTGQNLFIIHSNGQSWIELGKEGTVDIYAANSFNVRTKGDINLHADQDVNINAARNLNMYGLNIRQEAGGNMTQRIGESFNGYVAGNYTLKVDLQMSLKCIGNSSFASDLGITYINGTRIHLNTGMIPQLPIPILPIAKTVHMDTVFSENVGWMNSPVSGGGNSLESIATRVPTHMPWIASNKGVNIKINDTF